MAGKVVKFVVKSAVAGSLIYVTLRLTHGPWRAPPHMARFTEGKGFMDHSPILTSNQRNQESPDVFKEMWNKGVKKIFYGLHEAPEALKELSDKTITQLKEKYKNASK